MTAPAMSTLRTTTSRNVRVVNARSTLATVSSPVGLLVNPSSLKNALTTSSASDAR